VLLAACGSAQTMSPRATEAPATDEPLPPEIALLGTIEFGTKFDPDTLVMLKPATRFHASAKSISYVIHLSEPAGATSLTLSLTRRSSGGAETTIVTVPWEVANPDFDTFANAVDLASLVDRELGTYVMRVIREGDVLAEGTFQLVK
jgi:hypothetical protein